MGKDGRILLIGALSKGHALGTPEDHFLLMNTWMENSPRSKTESSMVPFESAPIRSILPSFPVYLTLISTTGYFQTCLLFPKVTIAMMNEKGKLMQQLVKFLQTL